MKTICIAAALMALSATPGLADSLANAGKASTDSAVATGELGEAGVKLVAGAVAVPLQHGGRLSAAPGQGLAHAFSRDPMDMNSFDVSMVATGFVLFAPGIVVYSVGKGLEDFSDEPLDISPETFSGKTAPTKAPA